MIEPDVYMTDGKWKMTGRYVIVKGDPNELNFVMVADKIYRTNSLSDAMDKIEDLWKWSKGRYTVCIIKELETLTYG